MAEDLRHEEQLPSNILVRDSQVGNNFKVYYDELLQQSKSITFPIFELPFQKNTQFTGREEQLAQISDYLLQQNTLAITNSTSVTLAQAIAGLGGVGKSQLAIEYAYRAYEKKSYQIIWFMSGQNLDADYLRLAVQLKVYGENKDDIIARTKLKLQELGNYLLVIDDAENYEEIKPYLPQIGKNGHVLITTRHRLDWQQMLELGVFTLEEALAYFKKVTDFKEEEKGDVIYLVDKLLGLLPLALTQAGAFIKQTGISIKKYIDFFETKLTELWGVEVKARDYSQTITVTWEITINRVKQKYPQAEDLLRGVSCLASTPNKIDQSWLSELVADEQTRISALGELADYSLIEKHQELNSFLVHSLVQDVIFNQMNFQEQHIKLLHMYAVLKVLYPYKSDPQLKDYDQQRNLLPHLEKNLSRVEAYLKKLKQNKMSEDFQINLIEKIEKELEFGLLALISTDYVTLGDGVKRKKLLKRILKIQEIHYGSDTPDVAITLANLGNAYGDLGDTAKSKELLERALKIQEAHYGSDNPDIAKILGSLGNAYGVLGDAVKKKELLERALAMEVIIYGFNRPEIAINLGNLANTYGALGDAVKKKELLERVLKIQKLHYGSDYHPQVTRTLVNLGIAYGELGNMSKKKALLESALPTFKTYYGSDHPEVARILFDLGNAYGALGDAVKKKELLEGALKIEKTYYGADHPEVAVTLTDLSNAYCTLGDAVKAKTLLEQALKIKETFYGAEHLAVAITLESLGNAYGALDNRAKQKALLKRALKIKETYYGYKHPEVAGTLGNLGNAYGALGNALKQKGLLERALLIFETHYGYNHPEVAGALINLVNAYFHLQQFKEAKIAAERAYQICLTHPDTGPQHPDTKLAKEKLDMINKILSNSSFKQSTSPTASSSNINSASILTKFPLQSENTTDLAKQLRNAANQNNVELLLRLIQENKNLDINAQDRGQHQRSALHWAVIKEAIPCIKVLLQAGVGIYLQDKAGSSSLDYALNSINLEVLGLLLSQRYKLSLEMPFDFARLLRCAAKNGEAKILRVLIEKMPELIDVADTAKNKRTALHWAIISNHEECVRLLLNAGARVDVEDAMNKTAIDYAQLPTTAQIIRELLLSLKINKTTSSSSPLATTAFFGENLSQNVQIESNEPVNNIQQFGLRHDG